LCFQSPLPRSLDNEKIANSGHISAQNSQFIQAFSLSGRMVG
jgi:hypothetical protein